MTTRFRDGLTRAAVGVAGGGYVLALLFSNALQSTSHF